MSENWKTNNDKGKRKEVFNKALDEYKRLVEIGENAILEMQDRLLKEFPRELEEVWNLTAYNIYKNYGEITTATFNGCVRLALILYDLAKKENVDFYVTNSPSEILSFAFCLFLRTFEPKKNQNPLII